MKIIALLPVKNEAWVLRHCLSSLSFCDEVLAIDDNSVDDTKKILQEYNCTILKFDTNTDIGWSEYAIRSHLLQEARQRGATHMIAIDGDEMFSDIFIKDARRILNSLQRGEMLSMPWIDIESAHTRLDPLINKVFAWADNCTSVFEKGFIHVPRVPNTGNVKKLDLPYGVLHFQHLNKVRHEYKKVWYMMSEFEKGTRGALRINTTYHSLAYHAVAFELKTVYQGNLPDPTTDSGFWQQEKVVTILRKKGSLFFEPLDIWDLDTLYKIFIKENNRKPKPIRIPNFVKKINAYKNKTINFLREWHT